MQRGPLAHTIDFIVAQNSLRYVLADDVYLSPMYKRDVLVMDMSVTGLDPDLYQEFITAFHDLSYEFQGRFHWGKHCLYTVEQQRSLYPMWDTFAAERNRVDPTGVFLNNYTASWFAP